MSVERVLEYSDLESEIKPDKSIPISESWPANGRIEFKHVVYAYARDIPPVLRGVSFTVRGGEKIGIVGRTGIYA